MKNHQATIIISFVLLFAYGRARCISDASRCAKETKRHGKVVGNRKVLNTSVLLDK